MDVQATATFSPVIPEQLAGEEETFKTVVPEHYMRKQVPPGGHEVHNDVITHPEYTDPMLEEVAAMPRLKNVVDIAPTIDQTNKDQRQDLEEYRQMAESVRETKRAMERKARIAGILTWNELMCQFREEEQGHFKCRQNVNRLTGELAECTGNLELCRQERQAFEAQVEQDKIAAAETANAEKQQAIEATKLEAAQKNEEDNQAKIDQILLDAAMESTKKGKKEDKTRTDKVLKAVADSVLSYGRKGRTQTEKLTDKMKIEGIIGKFDKGDPFKTLSAETLDNLRQFGWQSDGKKQTEEFITTALIATRTPQDNVALALDLSEHSRIDDYRKIIRDAREKGFVDPNGKTAFELKEGWKEDKNIEGSIVVQAIFNTDGEIHDAVIVGASPEIHRLGRFEAHHVRLTREHNETIGATLFIGGNLFRCISEEIPPSIDGTEQTLLLYVFKYSKPRMTEVFAAPFKLTSATGSMHRNFGVKLVNNRATGKSVGGVGAKPIDASPPPPPAPTPSVGSYSSSAVPRTRRPQPVAQPQYEEEVLEPERSWMGRIVKGYFGHKAPSTGR